MGGGGGVGGRGGGREGFIYIVPKVTVKSRAYTYVCSGTQYEKIKMRKCPGPSLFDDAFHRIWTKQMTCVDADLATHLCSLLKVYVRDTFKP